MALIFKKCGAADGAVLLDFARRTYFETFARWNTEENMEAYLAEAFAPEKFLAELADRDSSFYGLLEDGTFAGYLKLNEAPAQTELHDRAALEIERIYVAREFQGLGFGKRLMDQALAEARSRKKAYVWLGVWENNEKALRFYRSYGFYPAGTHVFVMGDDAQTDYLMRKDL